MSYVRFVLVMLLVTWVVRHLVGEMWLAVAIALAVNVLLSWPRKPKGEDRPEGEARPEGGVRAWSDPEPEPGREIRSFADLKAADTTFAAEARKAFRRGREKARREREARDGEAS
jgi:hypothetical protein